MIHRLSPNRLPHFALKATRQTHHLAYATRLPSPATPLPFVCCAHHHHHQQFPLSADPSSIAHAHASIHTSSSRHGMTGISFQAIPDSDLKMMKWMKSREIDARKRYIEKIGRNVWNAHPRENWRQITFAKARELLNDYMTNNNHYPPSDWQSRQFYNNTLKEFAPWRYSEEQEKRKYEVDRLINEIFDEIKRDIKQGKIVEMSKNEMTQILEEKLGSLPTSDEVDRMWADRYQVPRAKWVGDE